MSRIPAHTIGFGAVVIPHLNEWQGFYLVDDKSLHRMAVMTQMTAMMTMGSAGVIGALQASVVQAYVEGKEDNLMVQALALHGITKKAYFWIKASIESEGTRTEMFELQSRSPSEASLEINNLPEVLEIKKRLRVEMMKPKSSRS